MGFIFYFSLMLTIHAEASENKLDTTDFKKINSEKADIENLPPCAGYEKLSNATIGSFFPPKSCKTMVEYFDVLIELDHFIRRDCQDIGNSTIQFLEDTFPYELQDRNNPPILKFKKTLVSRKKELSTIVNKTSESELDWEKFNETEGKNPICQSYLDLFMQTRKWMIDHHNHYFCAADATVDKAISENATQERDTMDTYLLYLEKGEKYLKKPIY